MSKVVIISGAGISAESGISTFRDKGGLWSEYDEKIVCNHESLKKHEKLTLEFYDKRRADIKNKEPNHAHKVIAQLKQKYTDKISVITQNVDDLFEKVGMDSNDVLHLHGFLTEVRCQNKECNLILDIGYKKIEDAHNGKCPKCHTKLRPNVVLFGEGAPKYRKLHKEIKDCVMLIIIGTSGNVINTDSFLNPKIKVSILNNLEPSHAINDELYSMVLYKKASKAIDRIAFEIAQFLRREEVKPSNYYKD